MPSKPILSAAGVLIAGFAAGQPAIYETEPNDTPAQATRISGPAVLIGSMSAGDQDGFLWIVSDVDAQKRWIFELKGIPGLLTIVDVLRLDYAENGVDVSRRTKFLTLASRDGAKPAVLKDVLFEPGEYLLGVARAGAGGGYRPRMETASFGEAAVGAGSATDAARQDAGAYRLTIAEGSRLVLDGNPRPHDSKERARSLRANIEHAAFTDQAAAWFSFAIDERQAAERWEIGGQVPLGRTAMAFLRDAAGGELARVTTDARGAFAFRDLGLKAGTSFLEIREGTGGIILAVAARATGTRIEGAEAEPNDVWNKANRADLSAPVTGRMGRANDSDYFSFMLDEAVADRLVTLALETASGASLQLCLLDGGGRTLQCRERKGGVTLPDLTLAPGEYGLLVARGSAETAYTVRMTPGSVLEPGVEAEPNDRIEFASSVPAGNRIRGRFDGPDDVDFHRIVVTDDPQLWRFQVIGDNVQQVAYHDGAGIQNARVRPSREQRRVRLENVFLFPGEHYVSVSGRDEGEYTLLARPIGPPDPNGEREPNDDTSRMQLLRVGQTRTGLLNDTADQDNYRFFLAAWDHIRLVAAPPADGTIQASLYWDTAPFLRSVPSAAGQPLVLEGVFPPGDYRLALSAQKPSEAEYRVSLERRDRFTCPADCEPNDNPAFASPVPPSLVVEGRVGQWSDSDWWALPLLEQESELLIVSAERRELALVASLEQGARNLLQWDAGANRYRAVVPARRPAFLHVKRSRNPEYRIELEFAPGPAPAAPPGELPLTMALALNTETVAAYLPVGQTIHGRVTLEHVGGPAAPVELSASTSDMRWRADLERAAVSLSAGAAATVPVTVRVPPDAWADTPVRISVRAVDASGAHRTSQADVTAGRRAAPVDAVRDWAVPESMRGGFNAAWQALGARRVPDPAEKNPGNIPGVGDGFDFLFDGIAVRKQGLAVRGGHGGLETVPVTAALAGDQPLTVVGFAFTALGHNRAFQYPRDVVVQLSMDGASFETVATPVLDPVSREQFVALPEPREARFARLLLDTNWEGRGEGLLGLGEWKVIARPGLDVSGGTGFDLASPELGGHVVWAKPVIAGHWDRTILTEKEDHSRVRVRAGERMEWVVGFHHNRAARIERLEWIDAAKAPPTQRIKSVALAVSIESPLGPWQPIGPWTLPAGGGTGELAFDQPVWARYVKFSTPVIESPGSRDAPERIRIWEQPTAGDGYRSILTEWGDGSQHAFYEALQDVEAQAPLRMANNTERARAAPLDPDVLVSGEVELGRQEHWYRLAVEPEHNVLALRLAGDPTVRTQVHLENASGEPIPLRRVANESTPREHVLEAIVPPGSTVFARVGEPPRNVLFLWDTSASVGAYLPVIYNSLLAYAEDLVPGRDAANFLPFGGSAPLLRDWYGEPYILQTVLNDYPRKDSSSEAERTLYNAARALAPRPGTKAIVMVTDAATGRHAAVWDAFAEVHPRIFGLGVSSEGAFGRDPENEQDLMQNWSRVNGGHYAHLLNEGEMEVAFDRAATLLRRPAPYTLVVSSEARANPGPGRLTVTSGSNGATSGSGAAIELILDASGSMLQRLGDKRRIEIAKDVLTGAVSKQIPAGTPVALRVFGHRQANACRSDLEAPLAPLDPAALTKTLRGITAMNLAKTPIADSLAKVEADLKGASGRRVVVLLTDGEETCDGDPEEVIRALQDKGIDVTLNIVGFAIDDAELEAQFRSWAELGSGRYLSAPDERGLSDALQEALQMPYTVYDTGGGTVARGLVDGDAVELEQGYYRVDVQASPRKVFERVEVAGEEVVTLTVH